MSACARAEQVAVEMMMCLGYEPPRESNKGRAIRAMQESDKDEPEDASEWSYSAMCPEQRQGVLLQFLRADGPQTIDALSKILGAKEKMCKADMGHLRTQGKADFRNFGNYWVWWAK